MDTMKIAVSLPTLLYNCTAGRSEVEIEAATLDRCLDRLLEEYPLLKVHLFDEAGNLRQHVNLFYNEENLKWMDDWRIELRSGDRLTILQAVSGG